MARTSLFDRDGAPPKHRYRAVVSGVDRLPRADMPRHRHQSGYATLVLEGSFTEAAFYGRVLAMPGDVLLHGRFDCHANTVASAHGPTVLRLPWHMDTLEGRYRIADPDLLVRLAERDPRQASASLYEMLPVSPQSGGDHGWPDELAEQIGAISSVPLAQWAEEHRLSRESVSRGFRHAFGVSPRRFGLELRTRRAWLAVVNGSDRFVDIAHDQGFADQAHMSRNISAFTGHPPSVWRAQRNRSATN